MANEWEKKRVVDGYLRNEQKKVGKQFKQMLRVTMIKRRKRKQEIENSRQVCRCKCKVEKIHHGGLMQVCKMSCNAFVRSRKPKRGEVLRILLREKEHIRSL
jgi:hypothetical protein